MPQNPAALAKLTVPGALHAVRRERLFRRFEGSAPAAWVAAPPGAGKTTLAASYAAVSKRPCLWYRIDRGDADPASFFYFMRLAAVKAAPRRSIVLPLLSPEYLPDLPGFTRRFFRTLFARLSPGSLLVLDNYHELDNFPVFHELMRDALEELPAAGARMIILSRTEPPPAFARLTANRQIHLIGWNDLRLTEEETSVMVGEGFGAETVRRLHERAGGWAAGVILLLRHFESRGAENETLPMQSRQSVFNYFAEEIFATVPDKVRRFLVATAFFDDFTATMAERLGGHADAGEILEDLCRQHCFIDSSGSRETSYRYHDLFRDFLRAQAGEAAPACRRAAAGVLADCGCAVEAIPLLLENGDWETAVGLILGQAHLLVVQGRWQTLCGWIDALPQGMMDAVPWLRFWRGVAELSVRPSAGRVMIERAYESFAAAGDVMGQLLSASAIIEANFHEWADFSVLDKWIDVLESFGGAQIAFPSAEVEMRVLTGMLTAIGHRRPAHPMAQALMDRLETMLGSATDASQRSITAAFALWYAYWIGDFAQARRIHAIAARLLKERQMTPLTEILLRCMKGQGDVILGEKEEARREIGEAIETSKRHGLTFARGCYVHPIHIYCCLSFGDLAAAERAIAETETLAPFSGAMNASQDKHSRGWLALLRGNARQASEYMRAALDLADRSGSIVAQVWIRAALAQSLIELGDFDEAELKLRAARALVPDQVASQLTFHLGFVDAWLALHRDDRTRCHNLLREVFALGAAQGFANNLHWVPRMMSRLCAEALAENIETGYVRWLIRKRDLLPPSPDWECWPWPLEIFTLGSFEALKDGRHIEFTRKTPKKPIALLKAIIALGGRDVPERRLVEALWRGTEADAASEALAVTLHRLRKLLGVTDAIQVKGSKIGLNPDVCRIDAGLFESLVERADAAARDGRAEDSLRLSRSAMALYRGNFLADDSDEGWAISMRERLRMKFIGHIAAIAKLQCERKQCETVLENYLRGLDTDNLIEMFYRELMRCHHCLGRNAEGLAVYRRMKQTLSVVLGIAPSAESETLHRALLSRGAN